MSGSGVVTVKAGELVLDPGSVSPDLLDLSTYDEFLNRLCGQRTYQKVAIKKAATFLLSGRYQSIDDLVRELWPQSESERLRAYYGDIDTLIGKATFPGKLAATLDLATATGKSYVMYGVARIALNEGKVRRVLVLGPSLEIERGLHAKFTQLAARNDLTDALPHRPAGVRNPVLQADGHSIVADGHICIENREAVYEGSASAMRDSFAGTGADTLVINDETHHVWSDAAKAGGTASKRATEWWNFCNNEAFGFGRILGVTGTAYRTSGAFPYFADVLYRYGLRDAMVERYTKQVEYVIEETGSASGSSATFEMLWQAHQEAKRTYAPYGIKPVAIAVTDSIKNADRLVADFCAWAAKNKKTDVVGATIAVHSKAKEGRARLATVDLPSDPTEFIFSVSMLTEGWDVANVFTIVPHDQRAFNSHLLVAQVLGRGLRVPVLDQQHASMSPPEWKVTVLNHRSWAGQVQDVVNDVLERDETISVSRLDPAAGEFAPHFDVDRYLQRDKRRELAEEQEGAAFDLELLETGAIKLAAQRKTVVSEKTLVNAMTGTTRSMTVTPDGATQVPVRKAAARMFSVARRLRFNDPDMQKAVNATTTDTYARFIRRSMDESNLRSHTALSEENLARLERAIREQVFPPQRSILARYEYGTVEEFDTVDTAADITPSRPFRMARLTKPTSHLFYSDASLEQSQKPTLIRLRAELEGGMLDGLATRSDTNWQYRTPFNLTVTSHMPERRFVELLLSAEVARQLHSWVKCPDTGFYEIRYTIDSGDRQGEYGLFNPDFLVEAKREEGRRRHVCIVEIKSDDEDSDTTRCKVAAAEHAVTRLNTHLADRPERPTYSFHLLTPTDYPGFRSAWQSGVRDVATFVGLLHAELNAENEAAAKDAA